MLEVKSIDEHKMHIPDYGYHYAGRLIDLPNFERLENLVKDITYRIASLTKDKFLGNSNFAILFCGRYSDLTAQEPMLNAIKEQFENLEFPDTINIRILPND